MGAIEQPMAALHARRSAVKQCDDDDPESVLCVVCLDFRAEMVMRACGHLVFCTRCCRRMVALKKGINNVKQVSSQQYSKVGLPCPVCRQVSVSVRKGSPILTGAIYKP